MEVVFDWFFIVSIAEISIIRVLGEFTMLLWLAFCLDIMLALEDLYGDLWFCLRANQHMEVLWAMLSLDVSR